MNTPVEKRIEVHSDAPKCRHALAPAGTDGTPASSPLGLLLAACQCEFGPHAPAGVVVSLTALSGFTQQPTSIRTIGNAACHPSLGLFVEAILGSKRAMFVTSSSESALIRLGADPEVRTIIHGGQLYPGPLLEIFGRLIRGEPNRYLDSGQGEEHRARSFDRPVSIVLLEANEIDDPSILSSMLTIRLKDSPPAVQHDWEKRMKSWCDGAPYPVKGLGFTMRLLRERISSLPLDARLVLDREGVPATKPINRSDQNRLAHTISMAGVCAVMRGDASHGLAENEGSLKAIHISRRDIEFIVQLLDLVGMEDDRSPITTAQAECLRVLQRLHEKNSLANVENDGNWIAPDQESHSLEPILFTVKDVQGMSVFSSLSPPAVADRINGLESKGFVERVRKANRQFLYQITQRGLSYERSSLARLAAKYWEFDLKSGTGLDNLVEHYLRDGNSAEVGQVRNDSSGDQIAAGPHSIAQDANFGSFSPPPQGETKPPAQSGDSRRRWPPKADQR